jgi:hypothetical protein
MTSKTNITLPPIAEDVEFDNSTNGFASTDVQSAIEENQASASPGFSFGRPGNVSANTWLRRPGNVSSNRAGVTVSINNPVIVSVAVSNRNIETYTIEIYEHEGNQVNLTLLGSVNIVAARGGIFPVNITATQGRQLAVRLGSSVGGTTRDIGVDLVLKGDV